MTEAWRQPSSGREEEAAAFAAAEAHVTVHLRRLRWSGGLIALSGDGGFKSNHLD